MSKVNLWKRNLTVSAVTLVISFMLFSIFFNNILANNINAKETLIASIAKEFNLTRVSSLQDASNIAGFQAKTLSSVPQVFTTDPLVEVHKYTKELADKSLDPTRVTQTWENKDKNLILIFDQSPYRIKIGGPTKPAIINGYPGESQLLEATSFRPPLLTLTWSDEEMHYKLLATLADTIDKSVIYKLAEFIK